MLFWAGLRGAVGVALAAGFKGPNAQMMRTTVLIVVVLTVVLFGGTTSRMLELLGIRTGVEDDTAVSSDEDETLPPPTRSAWTSGFGGRGRGHTGRWNRFYVILGNPPRGNAARVCPTKTIQPLHQNPPSIPMQNQNPPHGLFSASSSDSFDSDVAETTWQTTRIVTQSQEILH
jgi:sodium/hydrogen exchanger-like protein 6/7